MLFGRTQPLIRYEMSDSITPSDRVRCPCGRPYPLIEGVQGRVEEALEFPGRAGGQIRVQPAVFHVVMDAVPAEGWQLVQEPDRLAVLLAGAPDAFDDDLADRLTSELRSRGVVAPQIEVRRLHAIPRTALGKAPADPEEQLRRSVIGLGAVCVDARAFHLIARSPAISSNRTTPDHIALTELPPAAPARRIRTVIG